MNVDESISNSSGSMEDKGEGLPELPVLERKLAESLNTFECVKKTISSINEKLLNLEPEALEGFLEKVISSKAENAIICDYKKHETLKKQLEMLCNVRHKLNEYKSHVDSLACLDMDSILKRLNEKVETAEATHKKIALEVKKLEEMLSERTADVGSNNF